MNLYNIRNKTTGEITHSVAAESFPGHNNGWGASPDEYDVEVVDMDPEIAEEAALLSDILTRQQQVRSLLADWDNVTTVQLKQAIRYLLKKDLRE